MNEFGINDYKKMYNKYGLKLVLLYFIENHLFDIINRTDTHKRLLIKDFPQDIKNLSDGIMYMASFKSVVNETLSLVKEVEKNFQSFNLVDIGSGKGKVLILWKKYLSKFKFNNKVYGFEYNTTLCNIAKNNLYKTGIVDVKIFNVEVSSTNELFNERNIYYLFNPFGKRTLIKFIELQSCPNYIIYNNPVHLEVLINLKYKIISQKSGFHPNLNWAVLYRDN